MVKRELLDLRRFHVDVKDIKNTLQWWERLESRFLVVGFLAKQNLRIIINRNWPNDPRVGYMNSTLVEFIEKDEIVKELKEFEREKIVDMNC